jgi:RNA polymerase sigma-70 factor (ECF subfamily)
MLFDSSNPLSSITAPRATPSPYVEIAALVRRAQGGDQEAQCELVHRYQRRVAGFVHKMTRRRSAVEDIAQVVMIRMIRRLGYLRDPELFESWLFRMARNEVLDAIRRIKCRVSTVEEELADGALSDGSDNHARFEIQEAANHAIERLPHPERELILLLIAGHSYEAIAERTGLTAAAVKVRVYRMRLILRPRMLEALGEPVPDDMAQAEKNAHSERRAKPRSGGAKAADEAATRISSARREEVSVFA